MADVDARAVLLETLFNDPETRPAIEGAIKKKFPKASLPAYDARLDLEAHKAEIKKMLDEDRVARQKSEDAAALARARREIMDDPSLRITPEELPEVEKLMLDPALGPIASHRAAAMLYRTQREVAAPRPFHLRAEVPGLGSSADEFKGILDDPEAWRDRKTEEIVNDFRVGRGAKWR